MAEQKKVRHPVFENHTVTVDAARVDAWVAQGWVAVEDEPAAETVAPQPPEPVEVDATTDTPPAPAPAPEGEATTEPGVPGGAETSGPVEPQPVADETAP